MYYLFCYVVGIVFFVASIYIVEKILCLCGDWHYTVIFI